MTLQLFSKYVNNLLIFERNEAKNPFLFQL